ncbi:hypothetical protein AHFPHNDE_01369 [Pseudomonas sp. MM227]|nr:hypothetical protein AHFPHNDE_01369 [Pseudomonas sp. MM227]
MAAKWPANPTDLSGRASFFAATGRSYGIQRCPIEHTDFSATRQCIKVVTPGQDALTCVLGPFFRNRRRWNIVKR